MWKYDATGNRTKQTLNTTVSNLAYPATNNRLTSVGSLTRQYDAAGNLRQELRSDGSTRSYAYNAMNRLSAVTRTVGGSGAMPVASYTTTRSGSGGEVRGGERAVDLLCMIWTGSCWSSSRATARRTAIMCISMPYPWR
ncbi:MAG: RHS repeat protein [Gammaproteobacteria bacterium]|nr:RHS repeat protein [Gammaproteobacteria bacterium]